MTESHKPVSEIQLYESRAGQDVVGDIAKLDSAPEHELNAEQKTDVLEFESELMAARYHVDKHRIITANLPNGESLAELVNQTSYFGNKFQIGLTYALTSPLVYDYCVENGYNPDRLHDDPYSFLSLIAMNGDSKLLKKIEKESFEHFRSAMGAFVFEGGEEPDTARLVVFNDGTKLIRRTKGLVEYKNFLTTVSQDVRHKQEDYPNDLAYDAKKVILEIYLKRVNSELATVYPDMIEYWNQVQHLSQPQKDISMAALQETWKLLAHVDFSKDEEARMKFVRRLDFVRNGVAISEDNFSTISPELVELFEESSVRPEKHEDLQNPIFRPEEIEKLSAITCNAEQMQALVKYFLIEFDKLSDEPESTYVIDRPERAADGKWQVVVRKDNTDAMGAEDPEGVFEIPGAFMRTLTEVNPPIGVISGLAHELMHVFQADNIRNNPDALTIGRELNGKGFLVLKEAGAIMTERIVQARLFGQERQDNPHYLMAMQTLESGGSEPTAIKAFYESYMESNPEANTKKALADSVGRVKRLTRRRGGFDSQALNYAETGIITSALEKAKKPTVDMLTAECAFGIKDLVTLHSFGLLQSHAENFPIDKFIEIAEKVLREFLDKETIE